MKILSCVLFLLISAPQLKAQACDGQRYFDEIFTVDVTSGIKYGEAVQPTLFDSNAIQELFLDVYQPDGDTMSARPLIIWAFGGAFVFGSRVSPDIVNLSNAFSSRGYVNVSIDYRLSTDLIFNNDVANVYEAIMKASHDMAAAVRFFYKDAATTNDYRIDTNKIFIGGVSAGALAALHATHIDEFNEIPLEIYDLFIDNGAFTGNSGNPGYSQDIAGVINLCGAMGDTAWIDPIETPIVSLHGTEDDVVPYGSELITLLGINVEVDGSGSIHEKLDQLGTVNALYTFQGAGHTPFVLGGEYMDTTIWFIRDFLYDQVCPEVSSIGGVLSDDVFFNVFPNPSDGLFNVDITGLADPNLQLTILDYTGARICSVLDVSEGTNSFGVSTLPSGLYLVRLDGEHLPRPYYQRLVVK